MLSDSIVDTFASFTSGLINQFQPPDSLVEGLFCVFNSKNYRG